MRALSSRPYVPSSALWALSVLLALLLGCLLAAQSAQASIVIGQGIAGVKLGESAAQVTKTLGAPAYKIDRSWGYPKTLEGRVGFNHQLHVNGMWTISRRQQTSKGVGPGSSLTQVRKAYPAAKCATGPFGPASVNCVLKSKYHGRAVETAFLFFTRSAGMREVDIGFS